MLSESSDLSGFLPSKSIDIISSLRRGLKSNMRSSVVSLPHQGALCLVDDDENPDLKYAIEVSLPDGGSHELYYTRMDFDFAQRLFSILDTESRGYVDRVVVKEFVTLRCPVFWKRDDDLRSLNLSASDNESPTFDEIWKSVVVCSDFSANLTATKILDVSAVTEIGVEGWMVFCRFIALAQYLEAKRRFMARHSQQTMRHRNSPRGSELVVIDVPPLESPAPLSPLELARYEERSKSPLPLPELDLDHSLVAAHDSIRRRPTYFCQGEVKISLLGPSFASGLLNSSSSSSGSSNLEFSVSFTPRQPLQVSRKSLSSSSSIQQEEIVVRRSMTDLKWLDDTFTSHKVLGGTLCGRILPPFPSTSSRPLSSHFQRDRDSVLRSSLRNTTGGAIKAAATSVGFIAGAAKSLFGGYLTGSNSTLNDETPSQSSASSNAKKQSSKRPSLGRVLPENYFTSNSPTSKARQLERYLNYLLEHPALSTSFPLNTILKASQSGLEAAKVSLEECNNMNREYRAHAPHLDDGKVTIPFWPSSSNGDSSNLTWVRTAAQAAMALKVHGMLETSGMNSASARLQHASLPSFGSTPRVARGWEEEEESIVGFRRNVETETFVDAVENNLETNNFEDGVVTVQSELQSEEMLFDDNGYDLLPLPVPAPERRILSAGSDTTSHSNKLRETRFHYGATVVHDKFRVDDEETTREAFLGDISVDENIDKLREVIGSVDNTLSRCLASTYAIGKAQRERQSLHFDVVRGLDSWTGMRGRFVSQRSLMKGVAGIEQSKDLFEEGDTALITDITWQKSLANAAVSAAEDVRSAVRVSRIAENAKAAASSAAFTAQQACESNDFSTIDEARAARTRASIAQSHAIHAAVVEHEAKIVKRRATLALANDVKCWNVHRKREMLRSCVLYARTQHEATRRAVDAWSSLRDGFIGSPLIPAQERRLGPTPSSTLEIKRSHATDSNEVTAKIYPVLTQFSSNEHSINETSQPMIVAVEHNILSTSSPKPERLIFTDTVISEDFESDLGLPFATAAPIIEEEEEVLVHPTTSISDIRACASGFSETEAAEGTSGTVDEKLSASMQSLVEGLMNWGDGFEAEEDHFALPVGMAASIVMEESVLAEGCSQMAHFFDSGFNNSYLVNNN